MVRIILSGELDLVGVARFEAELRGATRQGAYRTLVDVSGLTFCDLAGQRALVGALAAGARLTGEPPPCLRRLFTLTGQPHLLPAPVLLVSATE